MMRQGNPFAPVLNFASAGIIVRGVGTATGMDIAWALLAVSSEPQSETLPHQRAWAEQTCREKGWHLARAFEGVASGKDGPRRLTQELLLELRATPVAERPAHVLMVRLDRVGRGSIVESQIVVRDLFVLGARVYTRDAGEVRLDSAMDELIAAVQMAVARHENEVRSDKIASVYRRRRAAGQIVSNRTVYGVLLTKERLYVAVPECAEAVRTAFEMRVAGVPVLTIARWLQDNAPPQRFKNGRSRVVRWGDTRVAEMIMNRQYCGTVVDETTWMRAQRVSRYAGRAPRKARKHGVFPLGGMLRCACGRGLAAVARRTKGSGRIVRHYVCRAMWNHGSHYVSHKAESCEAKFVELLRRAAENPAACARMRRFGFHGDTLELVRQRHAELSAKLAAIDDARARAWRLEDAGRISQADVVERLSVLGRRRLKVEARLVRVISERRMHEHAAEVDARTERLFRTALDDYEAGDDARKVAVARAVIVAFGGVRVGIDGALLFGTGPDLTAQRRFKRSELLS